MSDSIPVGMPKNTLFTPTEAWTPPVRHLVFQANTSKTPVPKNSILKYTLKMSPVSTKFHQSTNLDESSSKTILFTPTEV